MDHITREIEELRSKCIQCGSCSDVCPSLKHGGCNPMDVMSGDESKVRFCIACGNCSKACGTTDPYSVMKDLLFLATGTHISQAFRDTGFCMPMADVPSRGMEPEWSGDDVNIMPGCVVRCKAPFLEFAAASALNSMEIKCMEIPDTTCCLHPVMFREMTERQRVESKRKASDSATGRIVTLCGGCNEELEAAGRPCDHIIRFLYRERDRLPRFDRRIKVALEPGCASEPYADEMVAVVEALGCEFIGNTSGCCGKGSPVEELLMEDRERECEGADVIVVGCPTCFNKFDGQPGGMPVLYISELVAMAAGDRRTLGFHRIPVDI